VGALPRQSPKSDWLDVVGDQVEDRLRGFGGAGSKTHFSLSEENNGHWATERASAVGPIVCTYYLPPDAFRQKQ